MLKFLLGIPPKIGSKWSLYSGNPFEDNTTVIVTAVKNGYVQYRYPWDTELQYAHSESVRGFRFIWNEVG